VTTRVCWLNGAWVPETEASTSIFDRGLLFGDGVYEVAAALNGRLLDADRHLVRLERSLDAIAITGSLPAAAWLEVMQALLERNSVDEGLVYLQVTRGVAERDFPFPAAATPTQFAYARPKLLRTDPNAAGIRLHPVPDIRWARRDIKSVAMLAQVLAKQDARAAGAHEALLHEDGVVTEGGSSTVWMVRDGVLITRPLSSKLLAGITRDVIIELAHAEALPLVERAFTVDEACEADECFITSATSFVLPVTRIGDRVVRDGRVGPCTLRLREAYLARGERLTRA
jgi:D-alanine transaminase